MALACTLAWQLPAISLACSFARMQAVSMPATDTREHAMTATLATDSTTERFLAIVRGLILASADITDDERKSLSRVKITYGAGNGTYRGITCFGAWNGNDGESTDFIEIAASAQESWVQLAGTTLHELGHSLAGLGAGHGKDWKESCVRLGFRIKPAAAGQRYYLSMFGPSVRQAIYRAALAVQDGSPAFATFGAGAFRVGATPRPCRAGQGARGGTSRGAGSGSRLRLWECECDRPIKVRIASDDFQAHCDRCSSPFKRK